MQLRSHYPYSNPTSCHPIHLTLFLHSSTLTHLFHSLSIVVHPPTLQRRDSLLYTPLTPPSPLPTPDPYPSITTHPPPPQSPFPSLAILTHHQSHSTAILFHPHPAPTYSPPHSPLIYHHHTQNSLSSIPSYYPPIYPCSIQSTHHLPSHLKQER